MGGTRSSLGCRPCRRKKRGCDLSRPICGQCQKIGAKCGYEGRTWTFVATQQELATKHQPPPAPVSQHTHSLRLTDQRQQLESVYLEAYLPSGESPTETAFTRSVVATWIPTICYLASTDRVARLAFDSCILMALGQMQGNLDFVNHGMAMYCQALSKANRALQHAATAQTDTTLATCEILAMCEMYRPRAEAEVSTHAIDFERHVQGTARLLQLRGCQKHVHEHGFTLFSNARSIIAHGGIARSESAFLDSDQWFEVPWSMQNRQRTSKDKLVDAMLSAAASLQLLDQCCHRIRSGNQRMDENVTTGMTSCLKSVRMLHAWEAEMLRTSAKARLEGVCANGGYGTFHLIMSYWAIFLLLSARCQPVLSDAPEHTPASQALTSLLSDPHSCALNIATHAHRYFPLATGLVGPHYATFPLSVALQYITACESQEIAGSAQWEAGRKDDSGNEIKIAKGYLRNLFNTDERARSTADFLRNIGP